MLTQIENNNGIISYDNSLIDQAVLDSLHSFKGYYKLQKKECVMTESGLVISINVSLKFGTSINDFSNHFFNSMSNLIENSFELTLSKICVNIVSIYSKKVSKRNIRIEFNNKSEITYNDN